MANLIKRAWVGLIFFLFSGCFNLFSFIDSPQGDAQLISAARACFDRGDYPCALQYYQQVSASQADTARSEEALIILAQNGVGMSAFISAYGNSSSSGGQFITRLAGKIISPGASTR